MTRNIVLGIVGVIIIGLVGRGIWAWQQVIEAEKPMSILKSAIQESAKLTSVSFTATTTGQVITKPQGGIPPVLDFSFAFGGDVDMHEPNNPASDISMAASVNGHTATSSTSVTLGGRGIFVQKSAYSMLKNFNIAFSSSDPKDSGTQFFVGLVNGIANSFANKWISIDVSKTLASSTVAIQPVNIFNDQRLKDYFSNSNYITAATMVGKETIFGIPTYHLKVAIQGDQQLIDLVKQITLEKDPAMAKDANFNKAMEGFAGVVMQKVDLDVWVGQDDSYVHKVTTSPLTINDKTTGDTVTASQEMTFLNQNKSVVISAPQDAQSVETIMKDLLGGMMRTSTQTPALPTQSAKGKTSTIRK